MSLSDSTPDAYVPGLQERLSATDAGGVCALSVSARENHIVDIDGNLPTPYAGQLIGTSAYSFTGRTGHPIEIAAIADDCAGNRASRSIDDQYGQYFSVQLTQETAATYSSGWRAASCTCWSGGAVMKSSAAGQSATFTATARSLALVTNRSAGRGTADILIDGRKRGNINNAAPSSVNRLIAFQYFAGSEAPHTMTVKVTSGRVDIDAFLTA